MARHPLIHFDGERFDVAPVEETYGLARTGADTLVAAGWWGEPRAGRRLRHSPAGWVDDGLASEVVGVARLYHFPRAGFEDGTMFATDTRYFNKVERFDRKAWRDVITMNDSALGFYAASPTDVWAGGASLVRWRGKASTRVPYRPDHDRSEVVAIGGNGSDDVWVASTGDRHHPRPLQLSHFDGRGWRQHAVDAPEPVRAIAVRSANEAWLLTVVAVYRWDGGAWTKHQDVPWHGGRTRSCSRVTRCGRSEAIASTAPGGNSARRGRTTARTSSPRLAGEVAAPAVPPPRAEKCAASETAPGAGRTGGVTRKGTAFIMISARIRSLVALPVFIVAASCVAPADRVDELDEQAEEEEKVGTVESPLTSCAANPNITVGTSEVKSSGGISCSGTVHEIQMTRYLYRGGVLLSSSSRNCSNTSSCISASLYTPNVSGSQTYCAGIRFSVRYTSTSALTSFAEKRVCKTG
jgi:hypothetical protein